eukprot:10875171-Karenia_brevis.AAC.1
MINAPVEEEDPWDDEEDEFPDLEMIREMETKLVDARRPPKREKKVGMPCYKRKEDVYQLSGSSSV